MRNIRKTAAALLALMLLAGCGAQKTEPEVPAEEPKAEQEQQVETPAAPVENEFTTWLPEGTETRLSQTEHLPELAAVIAETYGIPEDSWESTRYYYDYVDLNEDGTEEILAVAMGMYTSGSGGDSALVVLPYAGMSVSQTFTLIRMPLLVSDNTTDGAHDLIFLRGGGGGGTELVRLICTDGVYSNPSDAEVLESLEGITGTAILCNDIVTELNEGTALTLAGPQ